jgi:hypothetical protein
MTSPTPWPCGERAVASPRTPATRPPRVGQTIRCHQGSRRNADTTSPAPPNPWTNAASAVRNPMAKPAAATATRTIPRANRGPHPQPMLALPAPAGIGWLGSGRIGSCVGGAMGLVACVAATARFGLAHTSGPAATRCPEQATPANEVKAGAQYAESQGSFGGFHGQGTIGLDCSRASAGGLY